MSQSSSPRRVMRAIAVATVLALLLALPAAANDTPERLPGDPGSSPSDLGGAPEFAPELWFVEFASEPAARGGSVAAMARERSALRREARLAGIGFEQRLDFRRLWNGLSVRASASEASALAELDNVVAVYPVELIEAPEPQDVDPQLATALAMTGADAAQSELGLSGAGLSVAIVDTGIDYNHPDLGGTGDADNVVTASPGDRTMDHVRITHGWDYVGDDYDASDPNADVPEPDDDPMDPNGHGTHVAGIVGASPAEEGGALGVAPDVTFGAYKVFGAGSSSADVIINAIEDAHEDGMDIINMSLGAGFAWGDYPTSVVSNTLVEQGTVVVVAAGNEGASGAFSLGAPGNATDVIGVASADNTFMNAHVLEFEGEPMPYTGISAAELPPTDGSSEPLRLPAVTTVENQTGPLGCSPNDFDPDEFTGNTALIERGQCTFESKYANAVAAGASGVLIYNNIPGLFAGGGIVPEEGVYAAALTNADGLVLRAAVEAADDVTVTFTDDEMLAGNPFGGLVSSFSSYGMTPDLDMKPDIMAPGGLIHSTYPLAQGGYATVSGTSMATPHVAGAVALLLEAQPELEASAVRGVLQNSAEPALWSVSEASGLLDHSFRQGAGMMQIDRSITAATRISPSKIALGEAEVTTTTLDITNLDDQAVTYELGHTGTVGIAGFGDGPGDWYNAIFDPEGTFSFAGPTTEATFSSSTVTVAPGETVSVDVTIVNPHFGLYAHQAGGYLTLTEEGADEGDWAHVVPFAGMAGQIADIELWPDIREEVVGLDNLLVAQWGEDEHGDEALFAVEPGHRFRRGERPVGAVFMGFAAEHVQVVAHHLESGLEVPVADVEYARRSATPTEYIPYTWDGRLAEGDANVRRPVPGGEWQFVVRALMPRVNPDDPEVWVEDSSYTFHLSGQPADRPGGGPPPGRGPNG